MENTIKLEIEPATGENINRAYSEANKSLQNQLKVWRRTLPKSVYEADLKEQRIKQIEKELSDLRLHYAAIQTSTNPSNKQKHELIF